MAIKKAQWKPGPGPNGTLTIEATSTNPNAILSVFTSTGSFMFDLTNNGGGRYSDPRLFRAEPDHDPGQQQLRRFRGGDT